MTLWAPKVQIADAPVLNRGVEISENDHRIYSKERRGAYLIFRLVGAALIWGRRLFGGGAYLKVPTIILYFYFVHNNSIVKKK